MKSKYMMMLEEIQHLLYAYKKNLIIYKKCSSLLKNEIHTNRLYPI